MDGSLSSVLALVLPFSSIVAVFLALHAGARRQGGSVWRDIGPNGWFVGLLMMSAAGLFTRAVYGGFEIALTPGADPVGLSLEILVFVGLGSLFFVGGWNEYFHGTLRAPPRWTPDPIVPDRRW